MMHIGKLDSTSRNEFTGKRHRRADSVTLTLTLLTKLQNKVWYVNPIWNQGVVSAKINTEMHHTENKNVGVQTNVKPLKSIQSTAIPRAAKCWPARFVRFGRNSFQTLYTNISSTGLLQQWTEFRFESAWQFCIKIAPLSLWNRSC